MDIDPLTLRLFIAICETGSIAGAAAREGMAASAISKRVADIEGDIGTPLLVRLQRGVSPTPAGNTLLGYAKKITPTLQRLDAELRDHASARKGHVNMLANVSSMIEFVPDELVSFIRQHPGITIDIEERASEAVARGVKSGAADIGVCRDFVSLDGLQVFPYRSDRFGMVVSKSHKFAERESIEFVETLDYEHVGVELNASVHGLMHRLAAVHNRVLRFNLRVSTFDAAFRFIEAGLFVGILPIEAVGRYADFYHLKCIPLADAWSQRGFVICVRSVDRLAPGGRFLLEHLLSRAPTARAP